MYTLCQGKKRTIQNIITGDVIRKNKFLQVVNDVFLYNKKEFLSLCSPPSIFCSQDDTLI